MAASVTYQNSSGVSPTADAGTYAATNTNNDVSQSQFLQLLVTEMKNQDPTQPVDQTQTLTQLAQFSELEQMTNLNSTMSTDGTYQQLSSNAALIGQTVTTAPTETAAGVTGTVSSVTFSNGAAYLDINGQTVPASSVTEVQ
jgi:flagellar basal-body rod modification protein FlgD